MDNLLSNVGRVWSLTFIVHVNISNIVKWDTHNTTMQQTWIVSRLWFCRPISWICKKQSSVSHSSTEAEIYSSRFMLTHGLYSCSHSLGFGDWNVSFLPNRIDGPKRESHGQTRWRLWSLIGITRSRSQSSTLTSFQQNIDHIPPKTTKSGSSALLYVTEDNKAVIKMILKGIGSRSCFGFVFAWQDKLGPPRSKFVTLRPYTDSQTLDRRKLHAWWVEQYSSVVQDQPFQFHLLHKEFQLDKLLHNDVEGTRVNRRRKSCVQVATCSDEKNIQKTPTILRLRFGATKESKLRREPVDQNSKAWEQHACTRSQFFSWQGKSEWHRSDVERTLPTIVTHIPLYGSRLLHGQQNLWKTTVRTLNFFWMWIRLLVKVYDCRSSSSSSSRKRPWHEFDACDELLWKIVGRLYRETEKLSERNRWHN